MSSWFLLFGAPLCAQESRGLIQGRVLDSSGAVVPEVSVKAMHTATATAITAASNELGNYQLPYLLPGIYQLVAEKSGFKKFVQQGIEVRVNDRLVIDISLELGNVTETVQVTATGPLLETASASIGQVIDHRRLAELPLSGGNALTLTRLTPGVINFASPNHPSLGPAVEVVSNVAINGTRDHNSEYTVDGVPAMWGANAAIAPPAEMVEEFKVQTATFDASLGHSPGGAINITLRSGTNALHGTLFHFHNNHVLQGLELFQRQFLYDPSTGSVTDAKRKMVQPTHVINRYGGTVGGPVFLPKLYDGRHRTFWIYGYEGFIRPSIERGNLFYTVPTARQRQGDFSELLAIRRDDQIYDPATIAVAPANRFSRQPFPNNVIPAGRLHPMARKLLEYWPASNTAGAADGRNNYFNPPRSRNEYGSHNARLDHHFGPNYRVFARFNQMRQLFRSAQNFPNISTGQDRIRESYNFALDQVYVFGPQLLTNLRYGVSRFVQTFEPHGKGFDLVPLGFSPALVRQIDPAGMTFPQIAVDQYALLGNSYASGGYTNYHTIANDWTRIRGNHSIRFGAEFRLYRETAADHTAETPRIEFGANWTRGPLDNSPPAPIGPGLASFLLGIPTGGRIAVNSSSAEQSTFTSLYAQDDWRISRRLTLNLGLRYEFEGAPTERYNRTVAGFDFSAASPIEAQARANYARRPIPQLPADQFRVRGGLTFAGVGGVPRALWRSDRNNFSPRIGLAYQLNEKTVVRGGYGIFFVPAGVDRSSVNQSGFNQSTDIVASNDNGLSFRADIANPLPDGFLRPLGAAGGLVTDLGRSVRFFQPDRVSGYMQRWLLGAQREFPHRVLLDVSYVGNRGTKLDGARELNPVPASFLSASPFRDQAVIDRNTAQVPNPFFPLLPGTGLSGTTVPMVQLVRPFSHFTGVSTSLPIGYSWYHSLQVRAEKRFSEGYTVQANYSWSKFMEATSFRNESDARLDELISDQDRPHRFTVSGIYELPFGGGQRFLGTARGALNHLVGGWQAQAVYQAQSGAPIGFGNVLFIGDIKKITIPVGQRTLDRWFNTDGFERDSRLQLAQNSRTFPRRLNNVRQMGYNIWDMSLLKNFRLKEGVRLQFRVEFLNATNHSHLNPPNTSPTSSLFGKVTSVNSVPRQVYLALKLLY